MPSRIEWTDETWNPIRGCVKVSPGCANCYAERMARRNLGGGPPWSPWAAKNARQNVHTIYDRLTIPLRWKHPRRVFVCSMSDPFQSEIPDAFIDRMLATMTIAWWHTFQILTKRPDRMEAHIRNAERYSLVGQKVDGLLKWVKGTALRSKDRILKLKQPMLVWPAPNIWFGTSIEDQDRAGERLHHLMRMPGSVRFVSVEPMLGPVEPMAAALHHGASVRNLDWMIVGGESGPKARQMQLEWVRHLRDFCILNPRMMDGKVQRPAFFFKQWGEWCPRDQLPRDSDWYDPVSAEMVRLGKKHSGAWLDGKEWHEYPEGLGNKED